MMGQQAECAQATRMRHGRIKLLIFNIDTQVGPWHELHTVARTQHDPCIILVYRHQRPAGQAKGLQEKGEHDDNDADVSSHSSTQKFGANHVD